MLFSDADGSQPGVVVEFDGYRWHNPRVNRNDKPKTRALVSLGYGVIRIREALRKVTLADVVVPINHKPHLTADAVLQRMLDLDWINHKKRRFAQEYIDSGTEQATVVASMMIHERGGYDLTVSAAEIRARMGSVGRSSD
jgi:hypothetical protein